MLKLHSREYTNNLRRYLWMVKGEEVPLKFYNGGNKTILFYEILFVSLSV